MAAYVAKNPIPASELPSLIRSVHVALCALAADGIRTTWQAVEVEKPTPAEVRKSIGRDGIVSFIDGKSYRTLKRHLTSHGLDPRAYRERFGLPPDYPMVAPSYAERRSALAKAIGLGRPGALAERERTGRAVA